ncbi:MAG: hypothetical protein AAGB11_17145 [Pseudomonadota bacterium]
MHDSWKIPGDRVKGSAAPVTIFGDFGNDTANATKSYYGGEITRHHIINIQVLQSVWNAAVDRADASMFHALAAWAGYGATKCFAMCGNPASAKPQDFQKAVCWNPFNLVMGPSTRDRVADPGAAQGMTFIRTHGLSTIANKKPINNNNDPRTPAQRNPLDNFGFDGISYTHFFGVSTVRVAMMEFNQHIERLRRINHYMGLYLKQDGEPQDEDSLRSLLRSDRPSHYPALFQQLRNQAKSASGIHSDAIPGCLTDPLLWTKLSSPPTLGLANAADDKVYKRKSQKTVPWVSRSYLKMPPRDPKKQYSDSIVADTQNAPVSKDSAAVFEGKRFLDRAEADKVLRGVVSSLRSFARLKGLTIFVGAPAASVLMKEAVENAALVVSELVKQGMVLKIQPLTHHTFKRLEVRVQINK